MMRNKSATSVAVSTMHRKSKEDRRLSIGDKPEADTLETDTLDSLGPRLKKLKVDEKENLPTTTGGSSGDDFLNSPLVAAPRAGSKRLGPKKSNNAKRLCIAPEMRGGGTRFVGLAGPIPESPELLTLGRKLSTASRDDLVQIILRAVHFKTPLTAPRVESLLRRPSVSRYLTELRSLKAAIFKALPRSRMGSARDHHCFLTAESAVIAFNRRAIEQMTTLSKLEDWSGSLDFSLKAWSLVKELPCWDSYEDNYHVRGLRSQLAALLRLAIPKLRFSAAKASLTLRQLDGELSDELQPVLSLLRKD